MRVITTFPPYAAHLAEIADHPMVRGLRLNTVMPVSEKTLVEFLQNVKHRVGSDRPKIWIDLKCRQIRISASYLFNPPAEPKIYEIDGKTYVFDPSNPRVVDPAPVFPPWGEIKIDHKISVDLSGGPIKCWFSDGADFGHLVEVRDGDNLIMLDGPKKLVGRGDSINIPHPSLKIEGFFTEKDSQYIEAAKAVGIHTYMLSYVEEESDIEALLALDPEAEIVAKIESPKGVEFAEKVFPKYKGKKVRLMAARGDLFMEVDRADKILGVLKRIVRADPGAICASRILGSLKNGPRPSSSDMTDIGFLLEIGYKTLMLGDDICFNKNLLFLALDILGAVNRDYLGK